MQNDGHAVFDATRLFSHSTAESGKFLLCSLKHFLGVGLRAGFMTNLEVNYNPVLNLYKWDVETLRIQCTNTENRLYTDAGDIFCAEVKLNEQCFAFSKIVSL